MTHLEQIIQARVACDTDIAAMPGVHARKLQMIDQCHDIALQHGDRHEANNWAQARILALRVREVAL